jgi:hypothetical protein
MSLQPINSNIITLLKMMATDPKFLASLEQAKTPSEGQAIMSKAGINVDFTKSDVVKAVQSLTQPALGGNALPKPEKLNEWAGQLAKVSQSLAEIMFPR